MEIVKKSCGKDPNWIGQVANRGAPHCQKTLNKKGNKIIICNTIPDLLPVIGFGLFIAPWEALSKRKQIAHFLQIIKEKPNWAQKCINYVLDLYIEKKHGGQDPWDPHPLQSILGKIDVSLNRVNPWNDLSLHFSIHKMSYQCQYPVSISGTHFMAEVWKLPFFKMFIKFLFLKIFLNEFSQTSEN